MRCFELCFIEQSDQSLAKLSQRSHIVNKEIDGTAVGFSLGAVEAFIYCDFLLHLRMVNLKFYYKFKVHQSGVLGFWGDRKSVV